MYYKPETGESFNTHSDVRSSMLNVMFPDIMTDEMLATKGIFPITSVAPSVSYPKIARATHPAEVDGEWVQEWTVEDMTAEELEAHKPPVPQMVTRRQARQALLIRGLLDKVEPAIAAIPDATQRGLALIEWQDSLNFERHRPLVEQIGVVVGLDSKGLDDLFIFAATL